MKFKCLALLVSITCVACSTNDSAILCDDIEKIAVNLSEPTHDISEFIKKIELIPLETNDSVLMPNPKKSIYDSENDLFYFYTKNQIIYTFSGEGKFLASSEKVKGGGPKEYNMVLDMQVNPFLKGIDLLNPYGTIYTYSPTFEFITKKNVQTEFVLNSFMSLDSNKYVFKSPDMWSDQEVIFSDLEKGENIVRNYSGTIANNNMNKERFYKIKDKYFFVPNGVNYYFYEMDPMRKALSPIIYLDLGDETIDEADLPGRATGDRTGSREKQKQYSIEMANRADYLRNSEYHIPVVKFFNERYVYLFFMKKALKYGSHFIYDREIRKSWLVKNGEPFIMEVCFSIVDNVLLAVCQAEYVSRLVDKKLMTIEEVREMNAIMEDDNPIIIKYYLRN